MTSTTTTTESTSGFDGWLTHFESNPERQREIESTIDWAAPCHLSSTDRAAFSRSFQRFELGEQGDGKRLLSKAREAGDPVYTAALSLLVAEEQRHSALFRRGLQHLGSPSLQGHWSDAVFTRLRRMLGLRTELALFLIAETVALGYFEALATRAPDPVLRGIGRRILTDEIDHVRFQVARLHAGFADFERGARIGVGISWWFVAVGAATVLVVDHASALSACGLRPLRYWGRSLREFRRAAVAALGRAEVPGPTTAPDPALSPELSPEPAEPPARRQ